MPLPENKLELSTLIIAYARGEIAAPRQDETPWYRFYEDYSALDPAARIAVDAVFEGLADSDDPLIVHAVLCHQRQIGDPVKTSANLLTWLGTLPQNFSLERVYGFTLRAHFLNVLCETADPARAGEIHDALFAAAPGAGALGASIGRFLAMRGLPAVDALVRQIKPAKNLTEAIWHAGDVLGRDGVAWEEAERKADGWPIGLRKALRSGAASARRRRA
ncbi:hypothetical protein BH11PSE11_BH11PSE11_11000 [soil metagenome]